MKNSLRHMPSTVRKENIHLRYNEFCNSFENLLGDVCHDVKIEFSLQPLQRETIAVKSTTTDNDARFDNKAKRLWNSG